MLAIVSRADGLAEWPSPPHIHCLSAAPLPLAIVARRDEADGLRLDGDHHAYQPLASNRRHPSKVQTNASMTLL